MSFDNAGGSLSGPPQVPPPGRPRPVPPKPVPPRVAPSVLFQGEFLASPAAVAVARRAAVAALGRHGLSGELSDGHALVVSELVTNAVTASAGIPGAHFHLRLLRDGSGPVTVEVWDAAATLPAARPLTFEDECGRGLHIVAALSSRYGTRPAPTGKWTYATVR
ncbi:ATP-binding protein [Actinocorallia sp. A-T 12471]|uniref:ATP-binding protein n=1 Tax=Actinocorallia sp. A-T 12471 TaxID=3089813 RepID=UPI0029D30C4D|nr:ATP-binding protein [Actinocorallia sp. A-T 12471]MDX6738545.1 ATP-binding protein [Actinocorallia sp. A-T 12471]